MTGIDQYNYPAFNEATGRWAEAGHDVVSPAVGEPPADYGEKPYEYFLRRALVLLLRCNTLALLPNWQDSTGARLEVAIASALNFPIYDATTMELLPDIDVVVAVA